MSTPSTSCIIFDHDGVLVDSEPLHRIAWEKVFRPRGIAVSAEDYAWSIGRRDSTFAALLTDKFHMNATPDELIAEKRRHLLRMLQTESKTFPGLPELVRRLAPTYPLGIVSSAMRPEIDITLRRFQLAPFFSAIVSNEDVTRHKPDPEPYLLCAQRLRVDPARCVAIEDSCSGVTSARDAGMTVIALATTFPPEQLSGAHAVLRNLADTEAILRLISEGCRL